MVTPEANKTFLDRKDVKKLGLKIKHTRYKAFLADVHKKIIKELVLRNLEGFILPYRLGNMHINKIVRLTNYMPGYRRKKDEQRIEYNPDTFGGIYYVKWNKGHNIGKETKKNRANTYPQYNGLPLFHYKSLDFDLAKEYKGLVKYLIDNKKFSVK